MIELALLSLFAAAAGASDWEQRQAVERFRLRLLGAPLARFVPGDTFNPEDAHMVGPVLFDPTNGAGATGNNANVNYMGFVAWMTPEEFLQLTPPSARDDDRMFDFMKGGGGIGPPMLYLEEVHGRTDWAPGDERLLFQARGFEGRSKMAALQKLLRTAPRSVGAFLPKFVPVPIYLREPWRARHLSPGALLGTPIVPDRRTLGDIDPTMALMLSGRGAWIERITLNEKNYGPPLPVPPRVHIEKLTIHPPGTPWLLVDASSGLGMPQGWFATEGEANDALVAYLEA